MCTSKAQKHYRITMLPYLSCWKGLIYPSPTNRLARSRGEKDRLEGRSTCRPNSRPFFTSATIPGSIGNCTMTLITSLRQMFSVSSVMIPHLTYSRKYKDTSKWREERRDEKNVRLLLKLQVLTYPM